MQIILMQRQELILLQKLQVLETSVRKVSAAFSVYFGEQENWAYSSVQGSFDFRATGIVEALPPKFRFTTLILVCFWQCQNLRLWALFSGVHPQKTWKKWKTTLTLDYTTKLQ